MAVAPDTGTDKALMKRLFTGSKKEPVAVAIGKGADAGLGLLMVDKIKSPQAVEKLLIAQFKTAKDVRRGTAMVDEETDPKLVKFFLNKPVSGMAKRLKNTLKGTGFVKIELCTEDGASFEAAHEEDEDEGVHQEGEDTGGQTEIPDAPPPPPIDVAALQRKLAGLIPRIATVAGTDSGRLAELKKLAGDAAAAVKAGDGQAALDATTALEAAMGPPVAAAAPSTPEGSGPSLVQMQKSRLLWDSTRKKVHGEIEAFKAAAEELFEGEDDEAEILDALGDLDDVMAAFDERLMDALDDLLNEADPQKHAVLLAEAKDLIKEYAHYAESSPLVQQLNGDTPFGMKLTIAPTIAATLKALQATIH